ncbi:MAG: ABC transporter permease [Mycobacteriaceae bacterium]
MTNNQRFEEGTFTPDPTAAGSVPMLLAQTKLELILLLRNGEQLLLTMFIPITMLIVLCLMPFGSISDPKVNTVLPAVMTVAIMSTAFTGQAIAVGFDRRYGALKRLGATALPKWGVIIGKSAAVTVVVILQSIILGLIGVLLHWRPTLLGLIFGAAVIAIGTVAFASLGLFLGGTLKAEIVLALANMLWFAMSVLAALALAKDNIPSFIHTLTQFSPSGALAVSLTKASEGTSDPLTLSVLFIWIILGSVLAVRKFKFI